MSVTTAPSSSSPGGPSDRSGVLAAIEHSLAKVWASVRSWLLAYVPERSRYRRPPVQIHTQAAVPGYAVRLVAVVVGLVCASTVILGAPGWVVLVGLLIGLFCLPGTFMGGAVVIALALLAAFDLTPAEVWRTPLLVAGVPLMLQLAAVAGQASLTARIELQVIKLAMRRYLAIQVFAQLFALVGALVAGLGLVLPQLMALGAVALLALVLLWLPKMGPSRGD